MWNLGVIRVRLVERVGLADRNVDRLRLAAVLRARIVWLAVVTHEVFEEGIRARGVVRRVRHRQDGLVRPLREAFDLAERRISQLLGQQLGEVLAPRVFAWECLAKAFHRAG
jgi:hypothetical protein